MGDGLALVDLVSAVDAADRRLEGRVRRTPIEDSPWLAETTGARVVLKLENHQLTGSFKLRGALNRLLVADSAERRRGFVAASTGNHGLAVAQGASLLDSSLTVFVPNTADEAKIALLDAAGVAVRRAGQDCIEAEAAARAFAEETGRTYVSPYNDLKVIAGQGTVGAELLRQVPPLDALFVALGGGGLIAGVAARLKQAWPDLEVIGCSPHNSAVMARSLAAGRLLDLPSEPTLSDGTAGGVEAGSITFALCDELVDRCQLVAEDEIADALRTFTARHHSMIEGAAAVALAGLLAAGRRYAGRRVGVVLCGANIAPPRLAQILASG